MSVDLRFDSFSSTVCLQGLETCANLILHAPERSYTGTDGLIYNCIFINPSNKLHVSKFVYLCMAGLVWWSACLAFALVELF
jgi:hypothetical protein